MVALRARSKVHSIYRRPCKALTTKCLEFRSQQYKENCAGPNFETVQKLLPRKSREQFKRVFFAFRFFATMARREREENRDPPRKWTDVPLAIMTPWHSISPPQPTNLPFLSRFHPLSCLCRDREKPTPQKRPSQISIASTAKSEKLFSGGSRRRAGQYNYSR